MGPLEVRVRAILQLAEQNSHMFNRLSFALHGAEIDEPCMRVIEDQLIKYHELAIEQIRRMRGEQS